MQFKYIIFSVLFSMVSISCFGQNNNFQYNVLNINFSEEQDDFPIVRDNDNYFIIDENEYLILRENNESQYVIILEESYTENSFLESSFKLGPSDNINSSIGYIVRANKNFTEALIIEINNNGRYRIKQFQNNKYNYLSKKNKKGKWIKNKYIEKENIYNTIQIIDNKNKITFKINNSIIEEFESNITKKGYSGILIGPDTKSRLKYFYLKTDKQKQIQKDKVKEKSIIETKERVTLKNKFHSNKIKVNKDSLEIINLREMIKQINTTIELQTEQLLEKEYDITQLENWIKEIEKNEAESNLLISDLELNIREKNNSLEKVEKRNANLINKEVDLEKKTIKLREEIAKLKSTNKKISDKNQLQLKNLKSNSDKINVLEENLKKAKNSSKKSKEENSKRLALLENTLNKIQEKNTEIFKEKNNLSDELKSLKNERETLNNEITLINNQLNEISTKNNSLKNNINIVIKKNKDLKKSLDNQIADNKFLKEIFVYKDFELNDVNPTDLVANKLVEKIEKIEKEKEIAQSDSTYSIQLAVLKFPTTEFNHLDGVKVEIANGLYKYLVGKYIDLNDANAAIRKINNFGFKNAYIIKTSK